jgi:hypothetical protein
MKFQPEQPWHTTTKLLAPLIDQALKIKRDAEPPRKYLGASMMGDACIRKVAYQYHQTPKDVDRGFSGQTYRIFDMGHDGEDRVAEYLKHASFALRVVDRNGEQFGYSVADGKMKGHIDGVITQAPVDVPGLVLPALWENKALGNASFNEVVRVGIKESKPLYYAQVQIYMAYMQLESCLFTCINRDNGLLHIEVIAFDPQHAQEVSDRGVRVIQSKRPEEFPRIARESTDWRCKWCDYASRCWTATEPAPTNTQVPSWLTKGE